MVQKHHRGLFSCKEKLLTLQDLDGTGQYSTECGNPGLRDKCCMFSLDCGS